jgi:4'-phosphopantetheinyl transferase
MRVGAAATTTTRRSIALPSVADLAALDLRPAITRGELHLWWCDYAAISDPALLRAYAALLTAPERETHRRFFFDKDRHEYLVTRAFVRSVLSRYAELRPEEWHFEKNAHGRPFVVNRGLEGLAFNLSHSGGMVVCALGDCAEAGVDVEDTARGACTLDVAEEFFSPSEVAALSALSPEERRTRFFWYWTLKEAYIKARGQGLAIPLEKFSFSFSCESHWAAGPSGPHIRMHVERELKDDPGRWSFGLVQGSARHVIAYGVASPSGRPTLRAARIVPLRS